MSQWLLKRKDKKRSKSKTQPKIDMKSDIKFKEYLARRQRSPLALHRKQVSQTLQEGYEMKGQHNFNQLGNGETPQTQNDGKCNRISLKEESVYNEPWDIHCQTLNNGQMCYACITNSNNSRHRDKNRNSFAKDANSQKSIKHISLKLQMRPDGMPSTSQINKHLSRGSKDDCDTGCETSDSSDESDYYEFLENIERRLKIDHTKSNPIIMPRWDSPFLPKDQEGRINRLNINNSGYNAKCADEVIYSCGSDHSSGFHEIDKPLPNNNTNTKIFTSSSKETTSGMESASSMDFSELFLFPSEDEPYTPRTKIQQRGFTGSNIYQTGCRFKGNRLLGDLIQLNYEKQQLH